MIVSETNQQGWIFIKKIEIISHPPAMILWYTTAKIKLKCWEITTLTEAICIFIVSPWPYAAAYLYGSTRSLQLHPLPLPSQLTCFLCIYSWTRPAPAWTEWQSSRGSLHPHTPSWGCVTENIETLICYLLYYDYSYLLPITTMLIITTLDGIYPD